MKNTFFPSLKKQRIFSGAIFLFGLCCSVSAASAASTRQLCADTVHENLQVQTSGNDSTLPAFDTPASYPGGSTAWMRYLMKELRYPEDAVRKNISGRVLVIFTVNENGQLTEFQASSGPAELKEEAIRVIKKSGRWQPALLNGKRVESRSEQTITFNYIF